jgi:hypothetical protein
VTDLPRHTLVEDPCPDHQVDLPQQRLLPGLWGV